MQERCFSLNCFTPKYDCSRESKYFLDSTIKSQKTGRFSLEVQRTVAVE